MEFLKNNRRFSLTYGGIAFDELKYTLKATEEGDTLTTEYLLEDGLKITNVARICGQGYEWVNYLENTADTDSKIISELWDADVILPVAPQKTYEATTNFAAFDDMVTIYAPTGSTWDWNEFHADAEKNSVGRFAGHLPSNWHRTWSASGGRSSENNAPFFNIHRENAGYIAAIGWTGQWKAYAKRGEDSLIFKAKIEDTNFKLLPGEKIRTASFVLMPYEGSVDDGRNCWRRLVKEHFSLIGKPGRDEFGPLCATIWGGMRTESVLKRVNAIKDNGLPYEYVWMDAGWYGIGNKPTPDEFEGSWGGFTGDWRVSPDIHPGGLKDVSEAIHKAGMKFLLWFEPERVQENTPAVKEHPEYFLFKEGHNPLLNLGDEDALNYCIETLSQLIEDIGIDCYRQDFNTSPLHVWRHNDAEDRQGITEIKYITGLYRMWDALLERFPHLLIDNCASGGRRIDIETLRRSFPLWRSDYQCPANYLELGSQCHNLTFNGWMPYSGTGCGRIYDTYRMRSAYGASYANQFPFSEREPFGDDPEKMAFLKKQLNEYLLVRPYMSEDFYPLTKVSDKTDIWCAYQFDRPQQGDGLLQVFRREDSPYEKARFTLGGIDGGCDYLFTDLDGGEFTLSGKVLQEKGLELTIPEKRTAKIYIYKKL